MKTEIVFKMMNGDTKYAVPLEESKDIEAIIVKRTMNKEEAQKFLKRNQLIFDHFQDMEDARSRMVRKALDNISNLIIATYHTDTDTDKQKGIVK